MSNKRKNSSEGDFHIHIVRKKTKQYENFIKFRDILRRNNLIAKEYTMVKRQALKRSDGWREYYKYLKSHFIQKVLKVN